MNNLNFIYKGDLVMIYKLNQEVIYNGQLMIIWDYSLRSDEYTLVNKDKSENEQRVNVKEEDITKEIAGSIELHAKRIANILPKANREVLMKGYSYSFQRDLGKYITNAYQLGLLQSPEFYSALIEEINKLSKK